MPDRGGDGSAKSTPAGMGDLDRGLARRLADACDSGAHKLSCRRVGVSETLAVSCSDRQTKCWSD
jgi:hypothetical protein